MINNNRVERENRTHKDLNNEDLVKLLNAPTHCHSFQTVTFNLMLKILWESGMRIGELCNLYVSEFNSRDGIITLHRTKNKKSRKIFLKSDTNKQLKNYIGDRQDGYIFYGKDKNSPKSPHSFYYSLKLRTRNAGIKLGKNDILSAHSFRHHFIQDRIDKGQSLGGIQHAVGHSSLHTTGLYYNASDKVLRQVFEA